MVAEVVTGRPMGAEPQLPKDTPAAPEQGTPPLLDLWLHSGAWQQQ